MNKSTLSTAVFNFGCIRVLDLTATGDVERVALSSTLRPFRALGADQRGAGAQSCRRADDRPAPARLPMPGLERSPCC